MAQCDVENKRTPFPPKYQQKRAFGRVFVFYIPKSMPKIKVLELLFRIGLMDSLEVILAMLLVNLRTSGLGHEFSCPVDPHRTPTP